MKQAVVTIKYDEEKLNAVKQYMGKKDADFDAEMRETLGKCMKICTTGSPGVHREQGRCSFCCEEDKPPADQNRETSDEVEETE